MSSDEIFHKSAEKIQELAAHKNCIVCNFFNSKECPRKRKRAANGKQCPKWQYYLGREAT